jgi:uncharacterized membrane protein
MSAKSESWLSVSWTKVQVEDHRCTSVCNAGGEVVFAVSLMPSLNSRPHYMYSISCCFLNTYNYKLLLQNVFRTSSHAEDVKPS